MSTLEHGSAHSDVVHHQEHPTRRFYVLIAVILFVITVLEVVIYELWTYAAWLNPALIIMSAGKFVLVVGIYMHLKFDNRLFTYMFGFGMFVAAAVFTALWFLFWQYPLPPQAPGGGAAH
jgi:cytochrome c oxidase subunit IV